MTEVTHFLPMLREECFCDDFPADNRLFKLLKANFVEGRMRVSMIAKFETGIEPLIERGNTCVHLPHFQVELVFVDKTDGGNLLLIESGNDARSHVRQLL